MEKAAEQQGDPRSPRPISSCGSALATSAANASGSVCRLSGPFTVGRHRMRVGGTFAAGTNRADRHLLGVVEKRRKLIVGDDGRILLEHLLERRARGGGDGRA